MKDSARRIAVGIVGLGRSGWDIHARALEQQPHNYHVAAVTDLDAARRDEAVQKFGCRAYSDYSHLVSDPDLEVIVVATPNHLHKTHTIQALQNGKHVVCEKPFGINSREARAMTEAARTAGKLVAPFQNRRYEPHFQKVKSIIDSGILGEIHTIRIAAHAFKRRWDWQTLQEFGGGELNNNSPHALDQALQLFGAAEAEVFVDLRNVLAFGDCEDHIKITLKAPGAPTIDVELTNACAFPQDRWLVMGDAGGLRGSVNHLEWKWIDWTQTQPQPLLRVSTPDRSYNSEPLEWHFDECETSEGFDEVAQMFYNDFYRSVREGAPLFITPESVERVIALIEKCKSLSQVRHGRFSLTNASHDE